LTSQGSNLALYFGDQIVDAPEIGGRLLEPALSAPLAVAVESDACRFLK